ncbi:hypothetical protein LXL04_020589 [Taraxacum kok-saghyz]
MENVRDWMYIPRRLPQFETGVIEFLNASFAKVAKGGQISCPCKLCKNRYWYRRDKVFDHLKGYGFVENYYVWVFHGENPSKLGSNTTIDDDGHDGAGMHDNIDELLHDRFRGMAEEVNVVREGLNEEAKKFYKLVEDGKQELFPGCKNFTKLSFIIRIFLYKTLHGLSNVAFTELLKLFLEVIPDAKRPASFSQAKSIMKDLGHDYKKIPACPNDCMLYWKEHEQAETCHICHTSKWKQPNLKQGSKHVNEDFKKSPKVPAKVVWHFPLKPRLQRLFMCSDTAKYMTWHDEGDLKMETYDILQMRKAGRSNNIDIYLQPLIEELKDLWVNGLDTYDKYRDETFKMYAALTWTISDFPGYSMLSGWKTKGKFACPCCNHETCSIQLKHSKKTCYMDHRRFLGAQHPWRRNKSAFNGKTEERPSPKPMSGVAALRELSSFQNIFGKTQKKKNDSNCPWKKSGKSKDHVKGRFDLLDLGIKESLQPELSEDGAHVIFQNACFSMSSKEKSMFCRVLKETKLPYGCASNIARCVHSSENKFSGYKSHDAHIFLHYLLQVAVRKSLPKHVAIPLIRLGDFFRSLCSKVIKPEELDRLQLEITEILCEFEKIFVPSFFDIMVHLPIHLVNEIMLGGPVQYRWMYFMERYLCKLKSYVRNKSRPEGSIAEGYLIEECLTFCSRYMHDGVKTRLDRGSNDIDDVDGENESGGPIFVNGGHPIGGKKRRKGKLISLDVSLREQAHRYALFNTDCAQVDELINEHKVFIDTQPRKSRWARAQNHSHEFANWLEEKVKSNNVPDHIFWLAKGPSPTSKRYHGYYVNGYRFHTKSRDARCHTQNSGVSITALTPSFASSRDKNPAVGNVDYYGRILDIVELDYWSQFKVVLFRYPVENFLNYVITMVPRDIYDLEDESSETIGGSYWSDPNEGRFNSVPEVSEHEIRLSINDLAPLVVDANTSLDGADEANGGSGGDSDYDDTLWDWMQADEDEVD